MTEIEKILSNKKILSHQESNFVRKTLIRKPKKPEEEKKEEGQNAEEEKKEG